MKRIAPMSGFKWSAKVQRSSYAAICAKAEELLSVLRLMVARLTYLSRVIRFAPPQLSALIQATAQSPDGYLALIRNDLTWLHQHNVFAAKERGGEDPFSFWPSYAAHNVAAWNKHISIACRNGIRMQKDLFLYDNWTKKLGRILPGGGGNLEGELDRETDYMCEWGDICQCAAA